jgi:hypothetical protein
MRESTVAELLCSAQTHMQRCLWVLFFIEGAEIVTENWKEKAIWKNSEELWELYWNVFTERILMA